MICTTGVTIHKPLEQVWETFMLPANWKRWWGTELRKVDSGWGPDALMVWEVGFPSRVLRVIRGQELKIETQRSIITWWFTALDGEATMVQMEEKFTSDAPASMRNWHAEMAVVLEALHALAEGHEAEILPAHARAHIMPPDPSPRPPPPRSSQRSTWGIAMAAALLFLVVVMTQLVSNFYVNQLGYNPSGAQYSLALAQTPRGDVLIPVTGAEAFGNGEVIYQHDFVREGRGWDAFSGETWLENGSLHLLAAEEEQQIVVLGGTLGILDDGYDFQVEMVAAPHVQELHGLIFNFTDRSHFYQFSVWPESLRFELLLREGETWKILTPVQGSDALLPYPAVNRLGVRCADGAIELYINGKQSAVLKEGQFAPGGAVGVFAGGGTGELEVDNAQIRAFSTP